MRSRIMLDKSKIMSIKVTFCSMVNSATEDKRTNITTDDGHHQFVERININQ